MAASKKGSTATIAVAPMAGSKIRLRIKGRTPLIMNRMPEKARITLLVGGGARKTKGSSPRRGVYSGSTRTVHR